jgi:hypothetical protein
MSSTGLRDKDPCRFRVSGVTGLQSRAHAVGEGLACRFTGGLFFWFGRRGNLQALSHLPLVSRYGRRNRPGKSSGPPPFAPSLKVQGD